MTSINTSNIGQFRPFSIGFERLFDDIERISNNPQSNYPPYNVIKSSKDEFLIELAVAGFDKSELSIEFKDSILKVEGKKETRYERKNIVEGNDFPSFTHKGISEANFMKSWTLGDYFKVKTGEVVNGILIISVQREIPEEEKPLEIKIK